MSEDKKFDPEEILRQLRKPGLNYSKVVSEVALAKAEEIDRTALKGLNQQERLSVLKKVALEHNVPLDEFSLGELGIAEKELEITRQKRDLLLERKVQIEKIRSLLDVEESVNKQVQSFLKVANENSPEDRAAFETVWESIREQAQSNTNEIRTWTHKNQANAEKILQLTAKFRFAEWSNLRNEEMEEIFEGLSQIRDSIEADPATDRLKKLTRELLEDKFEGLDLNTLVSVILRQMTIDEMSILGKKSLEAENIKRHPIHADLDESWQDKARKVEELVSNNYRPNAGLGLLYTDDKRMLPFAVKLWEKTWKVTNNIEDIFKIIQETLQFDTTGLHDAQISGIYAAGMFLARWADFAFPRIVTSHTYAAALMCTTITPEAMEDLVIQWPAFEIVVPNGVLVQNETEYDRIRVHSDENVALLQMFSRSQAHSKGDQGVGTFQMAENNLVDLLTKPLTEKGDPHERLGFLARRLVGGLLLAMQHVQNFKDRKGSNWNRKDGEKRRAPEHRVVFVGSPITIDARPAVKKFLATGGSRGKNSPPSVQVLVRGHWKRQVVGIGRFGRKTIWVHPYWRGPEDAPILSRPKKLQGPTL